MSRCTCSRPGIHGPACATSRLALSGLLTIPLFLTCFHGGCAPPPPGGDPDSFTILFGGDTSYGENYQLAFEMAGRENVLKAKGYDHSPAKLKPLLLSSDLVVANLETPVTRLRRPPVPDKKFIHWADVEQTPAGLVRHNIRVVSLANNHTMDFGARGLAETLEFLAGAGIESFGAGMNEEEAKRPWSRDIRVGTRVLPLRIIGNYYLNRIYDEKYSFYARSGKPGVYALRKDGLTRQLRALKAAEPDSFVVLFPHWGRDYRWNHVGQTRLAHELIDAGADLILGHGAHMMQEIELYRGKWIAYGIGNLMFNSGGRYSKLGTPPYSIPARLVLEDKEGGLQKTLRFYPIFSNNALTGFQPRMVTFREFAEVYKLLRERSWDPSAFVEATAIGRDEVGTYLEVRLI